jgi:hypothetical protein
MTIRTAPLVACLALAALASAGHAAVATDVNDPARQQRMDAAYQRAEAQQGRSDEGTGTAARAETNLKDAGRSTGHAIRDVAVRTGHAIRRGAEATGRGLHRAADATSRGLHRAGDATSRAAHRTGDAVHHATRTSDADSQRPQSNDAH